MIQKNGVVTRKDNRISLVSTRKVITLKDYPIMANRELVVKTSEQSRLFEEKTSLNRPVPKLVSSLAKIINWLSHLGSGKINDHCLESRHHVYHNLTINRIRF